jgi:hypothetical protein
MCRRVPRYLQVTRFCHEHFDRTGTMPSYTTIAVGLNIYDRATVRRFVVQAEDRGLLERSGPIAGGAGRTEGKRIRFGAALVLGAGG